MTNQNPSCLRIAVALPIKETFTYAVPDLLMSRARIGCRVLIPFNNRKVNGYVLEKTDGKDQPGLKSIVDVIDSEPLFPPQMVPFFEWMANYYLHPIGQVIQSALPGGLDEKIFKTALLTEKGLEVLGKLPSHYENSKLLSWIKENPGKRFAFPLSKLETLRKRGWVTIENRARKRRAGPLMRKYVCVRDAERLQSLILGKADTLKAKNEAAFLKTVFSSKKVLLTDLASEFTNGLYLANKWIRKEMLEGRSEAVYRNPAGEILSPAPAPVNLFKQQESSLTYIHNYIKKGAFSTCLLYGITGSGKTEVYFRAIEHTLQLGRQAILMVPEIALAGYMEGLFRSRLGDKVAIYHSGLSQGERYDQWMRIARGDADVVIGARSALFAPLPRLGLIVVDEEHDSAYKQDSNPRYQARDAAVVRGKLEKALVILGSGTPSVQSFQNSITGRYQLLKMPERIEKRPLPEVSIINMKPNEGKRAVKGILSPELKKAVDLNLKAGNQTLLFLNRRGFHRLYICRHCGEAVKCPNCDVALTHHLKNDQLICHYCGFRSQTNMKCPSCGHAKIRPYGFGTEKLEQEIEKFFPEARVARMDTDSTSRKGEALKILKRFGAHDIDILVGTQMITKGYDFPLVTLVGVIAADLSLGFPDFRAGERTFQILSQVAGRAGRGTQGGRVIIQTFNPDHYAITATHENDFRAFFEREIDLRAQLGYPPFSHLAFLRLKGNSNKETSEAALYLARNINGILKNWPKRGKEILVLGPVEAPLSRIKGKYRWQILIKSKNPSILQHLLNQVEKRAKKLLNSSGVHLIMDMDPYQMS